jgi:UDP-2,3-diacylglucosamine hydrolase
MSSTLFIADLHLNDEQPEIYQRFKEFINTKARNCRALYILGDLFEYYLGSDALSPVAKQVAKDLALLSEEYHVECFFMAGNRDFLVSDEFAKLAKFTLLSDPTTIQIDDIKVLLTHSDDLCTDDIEYQKVRLQLRSKQWQQWFLSLKIPERIEFAKQARIKSQQHTQSASSEIMDVNQQAVVKLFDTHNVEFLLHGHTHRPAFHKVDINGKNHIRMVLGDWHHQTSYIEYQNKHFQLISN